jgi:protocatechuate 4,5-dioxygenase alpha chain
MTQTERGGAHQTWLRQDVQDGLLAKLGKTAGINRLIYWSRFDPAARERVAIDTEAVMEEYGLSEAERAAVRARDFKGLVELGGHPYLMSQLSRLLYGTSNNRNSSTAAEMLRRSLVDGAPPTG